MANKLLLLLFYVRKPSPFSAALGQILTCEKYNANKLSVKYCRTMGKEYSNHFQPIFNLLAMQLSLK
jgi:hypothetical protein